MGQVAGSPTVQGRVQKPPGKEAVLSQTSPGEQLPELWQLAPSVGLGWPESAGQNALGAQTLPSAGQQEYPGLQSPSPPQLRRQALAAATVLVRSAQSEPLAQEAVSQRDEQ